MNRHIILFEQGIVIEKGKKRPVPQFRIKKKLDLITNGVFEEKDEKRVRY